MRDDFLGFQFMIILNLYGIPFHAVVVFRPVHDFLFKSAFASTYWLHTLQIIFKKVTELFPSENRIAVFFFY